MSEFLLLKKKMYIGRLPIKIHKKRNKQHYSTTRPRLLWEWLECLRPRSGGAAAALENDPPAHTPTEGSARLDEKLDLARQKEIRDLKDKLKEADRKADVSSKKIIDLKAQRALKAEQHVGEMIKSNLKWTAELSKQHIRYDALFRVHSTSSSYRVRLLDGAVLAAGGAAGGFVLDRGFTYYGGPQLIEKYIPNRFREIAGYTEYTEPPVRKYPRIDTLHLRDGSAPARLLSRPISIWEKPAVRDSEAISYVQAQLNAPRIYLPATRPLITVVHEERIKKD